MQLFIDLNKYLSKDVKEQLAYYQKVNNIKAFPKYFKDLMNADYSINKDVWESYRGKAINIVLVEKNEPYTLVASTLSECYEQIDCKVKIVKEFPYQQEDKVTKLLDCVQAELWTVCSRVMEEKTPELIEYYVKRLYDEYHLGNIDDTQYMVLSRGCGVIDDYVDANLSLDEIDEDAYFSFYIEMMIRSL